MLKRWWPALGLLLALAVIAVPVSAGILTSGSYTYMFKGREQNLPVDILTVQGATLVPTELLSLVQVVPEAEADSVTLKRGPVTVQMRLGSETAVIGDTVKLLQSGPCWWAAASSSRPRSCPNSASPWEWTASSSCWAITCPRADPCPTRPATPSTMKS